MNISSGISLMKRHCLIIIIAIAWFFSGCDGQDSTHTGEPVVPAEPPHQSGEDPLPAARFSLDTQMGAAPLSVTAEAIVSPESDGRILSYNWDFGDGVSGDTPSVSHIYEQQGEYTLRLKITDEKGASSTVDEKITVTAALEVNGRISIRGTAFADGDVNDPDAPFIDNSGFDTAQDLPNPCVVGGYVNQAETGAQGRSYASGDTADFYRVWLNRNDPVSVAVEGGVSSDLDLFLYDKDRCQRLSSETQGPLDESLIAPADGVYYIQIKVFKGAASYSLTIGDESVRGSGAAKSENPEFVQGDVLVRFKDLDPEDKRTRGSINSQDLFPGLIRMGGGIGRTMRFRIDPEADITETFQSLGVTSKNVLRGNRASGKARKERLKADTLALVEALERRADVKYASLNYIRKAMETEPSDPLYTDQWHYPMIHLPKAWDVTTGCPDVIVAVVDTGLLHDHPDMEGQFVDGYDFISDPANALDGDGIDSNPEDPGDKRSASSSSFHGTHVAGTVAAAANNGDGGAGVASGCRIMPVRVLGKGCWGTIYDIMQGVRYAAGLDNDSGTVPIFPAAIINLSLGGAGGAEEEQALYQEIRDSGIIIVAAAGNEGDTVKHYPAAYEGVLSVSSVNSSKEKASYSSYGDWIDLSAPGGEMHAQNSPGGVLSTCGDDGFGSVHYTYSRMQGTSMASPHVAGVAALMRTICADLTQDHLYGLIHDGRIVEDIGEEGRDDNFGYGLIDAEKAVNEALKINGERVLCRPSVLNFSDDLVEMAFTLDSEKGSVSSITKPDGAWFHFKPDGTDGNGLGRYLASVDREGLPFAPFEGALKIVTSENTLSVPVKMRVACEQPYNAGRHYVVLVEKTGARRVQSVAVEAVDGVYSYSFTKVSPGTYEIYAGSDADNDMQIGERGEAGGTCMSKGMPDVVVISGDMNDLDFTTGYGPVPLRGINGMTVERGHQAGGRIKIYRP